jgi:dTDP-4-dehydrorhamnose 3,5-epimerase-like enzyme
MTKPKLIKGNFAVDDRGFVNFNNEFILKKIKRFYIVENHQQGFIRAWHAHKKEEKFVLCINGSAIIAAVKIKDFRKPDKNEVVDKFFISERDSSIVHIPNGYANGFKTLRKNTKILFFSTSTLKQSAKDDYRYKFDYWNIWKFDYR